MTSLNFEDAILIARDKIASLTARKMELLAESPVSDAAFQYADGLLNGAREVLAALVKRSNER